MAVIPSERHCHEPWRSLRTVSDAEHVAHEAFEPAMCYKKVHSPLAM